MHPDSPRRTCLFSSTSPANRDRRAFFASVLFSCRILRCVGVVLLSLLFLSPESVAAQPVTAKQDAVPAPSVPDVVVLILPMDTMTARIGFVYRRVVPRDRVEREARYLAQALNGQMLSKLTLEEKGVALKNNARTPKTSSASFVLRSGAFYRGNLPWLQPYLRAFRQWENIEVLFTRPGSPAQEPPEKFESGRVLTAKLFKESGVYRYEITLKTKEGDLPEPNFTGVRPVSLATPSTPPSGSASATQVSAPSSVPGWLIAICLALGGTALGAGVYLLIAHRATGRRQGADAVHPH